MDKFILNSSILGDLFKVNVEDFYELSNKLLEKLYRTKLDIIYLSPDVAIKQLPGYDIYLVSTRITSSVFVSRNIDKARAGQIIENSAKKKLYYLKYDKSGQICTGKEIKKINYIVHPDREKLITNIKNKMDIHKDLTINIVLYGKPGTGKSTFVEYIADVFDKCVHILPISNEKTLSDVISELSSRTKQIILIPEIDKILNDFGDPIYCENDIYEFLDGSNRPHGSINIITCNDIEKFERNSILSRPGRVHYKLRFDNVTKEDVEFIIKKYYPGHDDFSIFHKFIGKITHSELNTAVCRAYIADDDISKGLDMSMTAKKINKPDLYN